MMVSAIIVAAGRGERLASKISKPLIKIGKEPVIIYSLKALSSQPEIKEIIVVANPSNAKAIITQIKKYRIKKIKSVILGGLRRQDSVFNGLKEVSVDMDFVLVHDAARPFIDRAIISNSLKQAATYGAAIVAVPVVATIKKVHSWQFPPQRVADPPRFLAGTVHKRNFVEKTIDRSNLWEVQTPQVFKKNLLLDAYKKYNRLNVTDDSMLVEKIGGRVAVVMGSKYNIKITTPEDLVLAEVIYKKLKSE